MPFRYGKCSMCVLVGEKTKLLRRHTVCNLQQKLATTLKSLDRMRNPRREKPHITNSNIVNKVLAILVDSRNASTAVEHKSPLSRLVPMELAVSIGRQPHVHTCHGGGDGQLILVLVPRPSRTSESVAIVRETKGPLCVADIAVVGAGRDEEVAVQPVVGLSPANDVSSCVI